MEFLNPLDTVHVNLLDLLRNMAVGIVFALILAWLAGRSSRLISDASQYLPLFIMLIPTMILIITVIKTSIALSLGLVGALSIVRFRTPIKDPEELTYIFVAIAVGLGLGANQVIPTIIGFLIIVVVMFPPFAKRSGTHRGANAYIDIVVSTERNESFDIKPLIQLLDQAGTRYRIKQITQESVINEITLELPTLDPEIYQALHDTLNSKYKNVKTSIIDNSRIIT